MTFNNFLNKLNITENELTPEILYNSIKKESLSKDIISTWIVSIKKNCSLECYNAILNIYLNLYLIQSEDIIKKYIDSYNQEIINKETLFENINSYLKNNWPFISIIIDLIPDYELTINEEIINKIIAPFELLNSFEINKYTKPCIINYLDAFYKVRTSYFNRYQNDIFKDKVNIINELQKKLNDSEEMVIPEINIKPEQLGLLDITKLKN